MRNNKILTSLLSFIPIILILLIWQFSADGSERSKFLFSSPRDITKSFLTILTNGELLNNFLLTGSEALTGLVLGVLTGSILGFLLLYFPSASKISKYYIIALSSIPIFALAPMMIIWFGTGFLMKVAMAFFATVFVSIFQAYQGGKNITKQQEDFFTLNRSSNKQKFWKLTFPSSIDWLIQSFKLNSGLSILGAFIGEFIASEAGLGYAILKASGLYDVSSVLASVIGIILLTLLFNVIAIVIEKNKLKIIRFFSVRRISGL